MAVGSHVSRYVAKHLKSRQKSWAQATQQRVAAVSSMLGVMKSVKALGLSVAVAAQIRAFRVHEIAMANKIRSMMVVYSASGKPRPLSTLFDTWSHANATGRWSVAANALSIFTPALTMILYSTLFGGVGRRFGSLDAETAFTTVAILTMVIHPANMVMTIVPRAIACSASVERVQSYLLRSTREDQRTLLHSQASDSSADLRSAIRLQRVKVGACQGPRSVLDNVSLDIKKGWLTACYGAVGSGKSILAKAILGEVPLKSGTVEVASKNIGYCSQAPWLPGGTIHDVICGFAPEGDPARYEEAIRLCCLRYDLEALPDGDQTIVGSRGMNLSGGQRQRVVCVPIPPCQLSHFRGLPSEYSGPLHPLGTGTACLYTPRNRYPRQLLLLSRPRHSEQNNPKPPWPERAFPPREHNSILD
jgi:ATP-binding cassette, subfamily C (CFTR/MRP), member 1